MEAIGLLHSWAVSENYLLWAYYLKTIMYRDDFPSNYNIEECGFGYLEYCLLGEALIVFENYGYDDVYAEIERLEALSGEEE